MGRKRIIVEGADQQGKTEVCNILKELLPDYWKIQHFGMPPEGFDFLSDYMTEAFVISDRSFVSEIVYSTLRGDECKIAAYKANELTNYVKDSVLFLYVDRFDNFKFDKTRSEEYSEDDILKARTIYRNVIPFLGFRAMYVYNDKSELKTDYLKFLIDTVIEK